MAAIVPRPLAKALEETYAIASYELPYTTMPVEVRLLWHESVEEERSHKWLHDILRRAAEHLQICAKTVVKRASARCASGAEH